MADSVFVARRLLCNRTPGACRVNASEIRDRFNAMNIMGIISCQMSNTFPAEAARVALSMMMSKGQSNAVLLVWCIRA